MPEPGDTERFAAMYEQNRARVYAYAISKAGRQLADEILSEVFIIAWRRLDAIPDPPLPWLLAVARNVALSQFRVAVREQSVVALPRRQARFDSLIPPLRRRSRSGPWLWVCWCWGAVVVSLLGLAGWRVAGWLGQLAVAGG